jgi:hypothetical protein
MKDSEIIESLLSKLAMPGGRHLYGVLGTYSQLANFAKQLQHAKTRDGRNFPRPLSVNRGILESIPDDKFRQLVENEAKKPEPTAAHVGMAFEKFLRSKLRGKGLVVLQDLELLFAYNIDLNLLRTMATDEDRVLLLLPGRRGGERIRLFLDFERANIMIPSNLIAEDHIWELRE